MNLKRQVFLGSVWSVLGSCGQQLISFGLLIYIARKVGPASVGLVAFAMIFIDICVICSRFGQVEALQQGPPPSRLTMSTSFWMLTAGGLAATGILVVCAKAAESFAGNPSFGLVLLLLAPICLLQAWSAVPNAILRRRFNFRSLAIRDWLATLSGGIVGVFLAYRDYGVFALVGQRLANALVQTVATWTFLNWLPQFGLDWAAARRLGRSGLDITLAAFAITINRSASDGIIGATMGLTQLGVFRLGLRFFELVVQLSAYPISSVAFATFSKLHDDRQALGRAYLRMTQLMAVVSLPAFFGLAAIADILIPLALGPKWTGTVVIVQFLGFLMMAATINFFFASVMVSVGKSRTVMWRSSSQLIVTCTFLYIAAQVSMFAVMVAYVAAAILLAIWNSITLTKELALGNLAILGVLLPPLISCAVMFGALLLTRLAFGAATSPIPLLALLVAIGAAAYCATLLLGDLTGLWPRYIRDAVRAMGGAFFAGERV